MLYKMKKNEEPREPVDYPECGEACRPRYKRKRRITTKYGFIQVERWV